MITFAKGVTSGTAPLGARYRPPADLRNLHGRPGTRCRTFARLYLFWPPFGLCRRSRRARSLPAEKIYSRGRCNSNPFGGRRRAWLERGLPNVLDIRNAGLSAAIDLGAKPGAPGKLEGRRDGSRVPRFRPSPAQRWRHAYSTPPLIVSEAQIGEIVEKTAWAIKAVA